jgi:hypothetical protein
MKLEELKSEMQKLVGVGIDDAQLAEIKDDVKYILVLPSMSHSQLKGLQDGMMKVFPLVAFIALPDSEKVKLFEVKHDD